MKKLIFPLIFIALFSCKQKEPNESDFMQRALKSDDYKIVLTNFQRVNDSLAKKRVTDTAAVIYEYNTIAGSTLPQAKTITQAITHMNAMNKDSSFLKLVQVHLAAKLAKYHQDSIKR